MFKINSISFCVLICIIIKYGKCFNWKIFSVSVQMLKVNSDFWILSAAEFVYDHYFIMHVSLKFIYDGNNEERNFPYED